MKKPHLVMVFITAAWLATPALAQTTCPATPALAPRDLPAHNILVPTTVNPQLQQIIAGPLRPGWNTPPTTPEG